MILTQPPQHHSHHPAHRSTAGAPGTPPSTDPAAVTGKASAPGQVAKALIAEAAANGAELPANIQGKAASAIAHGIDMESFFASFMLAPEPPADEVPDAGAGDGTVEGEIAAPDDPGDTAAAPPDSEAISSPAPAPDDPAIIPLTGAGASSDEIAATLLEPLVAPESDTIA